MERKKYHTKEEVPLDKYCRTAVKLPAEYERFGIRSRDGIRTMKEVFPYEDKHYT
jgi:hypothetical protein